MRQRGNGPEKIADLFAQCDPLTRARAQIAVSPVYGKEATDTETSNPGPAEATRTPSAPDSDPAPNSPEDIGYRTARDHTPKKCGCGALIFWAQLPSGKSMPVDAEPVENGNVVLVDRGGRVLARVLKKREAAPPGVNLRVSHFKTCPNADQHRRSR